MYWKMNQDETKKFLELVKQGKPFVVYDLETTGKKSTADYVVQFSACRYEMVGKYYENVDSINLFIKPPVYMSQEVVDIHGITNEMLEDKPTEAEVFSQIESFMKDAVIMGYNIIKFDNKFMEEMYKRQGKEFVPEETADVYLMAKENVYPKDVKTFLLEKDKNVGKLNPHDPKLYSLSLSAMITYMEVEDSFQFHSADEDIRATWACAVKLAKKYNKLFSFPWEKRRQAKIIRMDSFKKSSLINYTYVVLQDETGSYYKMYYDNRTKGWVDTEGSVIPMLNMPDVHEQAEKIAFKRGYKTLEKFEGNYKESEKGGSVA